MRCTQVNWFSSYDKTVGFYHSSSVSCDSGNGSDSDSDSE